jgi:hypothetical protein
MTKANTAFDNDDYASARRMATGVFNATELPSDMRGGAALLMATSFGAVGNSERAIEWYHKAQPLLTGVRRLRVDSAISMLGGRP